MAYTLYLYKEFPSKSNKTIRLEIFQKDYTGSAIEIEELAGNPLVLNTDNAANDIDVPIIKTSLSINIIDTGQFDYSIFFTPDATKFKVIVKVSGTPEWTGFLTPDSFVQAESYRSNISLLARDNIGMLAEFEYDGTQLPVKINTTINNAFTKINFGGTLEYRVKKLDNAGISILNDVINGKLFVGRNYYEVVEILLRGIGCQLRYVGGNKYAIFDIADLKGYGDTLTAQTFLFIEQSGAVEIVPARKSIKITQDYGLQESIYDGPIPTEDFAYEDQRNAGLQYLTYRLPRPPVPAEQQDFYVNYYTIPIGARWVSTMALLEPTYFQRPESSILITGTNTESIVGLGKLMYSRAIPETNRDTNLKITVDVSKLIYGVGKYQRIGDELALWDMKIGTINSKLHFRCNFFFNDGTTIQYLSSGGWREKPVDYADRFDIVLEQVEDESSTDTPYQTLEFNLGNADSAGTLTMEIYPYWLEDNTLSLNVSAYVMELRDFDIKFIRLDEKIGGVESVGVINNNYNLAAEVNLSVGQVPNYLGNNLTLLAGIFQDASYYPPAFNFHRPSGTNYKLFELIGREVAHHYKTQKNKLSGTIINSLNFAAMPSFGKTFTDGVKNYALNYGALDFRNETMQVELIEVEDYTTEDYTFIEATIDTGGSSLGSGETEFIQWSAAGNAKRIYELDTASEADQVGAFVFIDKLGLSAGKKVPISSLLVDAYTKTESDARFASIDGDLTQDFSAKKLTTTTLLLPQSAPTLASGEVAIYSTDSGFSGELPSGAGSVTSIALTMPTGFSVSGSPITESGTFGVTFASGYFLPTTTQFATKLDVSLKGTPNGLAELDENGFVKNTQLPSYVDDVLEYGYFSELPATGTSGKIYVITNPLDTDHYNKTYRWSGTIYTEISQSLALGETSSTAYRGDRGKIAYDHSQLTGNPHGTTAAQVGALGVSANAVSATSLSIQSVSDLNQTDKNRIFTTTNASPLNSPFAGSSWFAGITVAVNNSDSFKLQFLMGLDNQDAYLRTMNSNSWGDYRKIWTDKNSNLSTVNWSADKLTSTTLLLPQTTPSLSSGEMAIYGLESGFSGELPSGAGSVTSISMIVPTGLSVTPATITESGTFTISYASGYSIPTISKQSEWDNAYTLRHSAVTLGTANGLSLSTQVLSLGLASTTTNGALSSTDWNTFNGKAAGDHAHDDRYYTETESDLKYHIKGGSSSQAFSASELTISNNIFLTGTNLLQMFNRSASNKYSGFIFQTNGVYDWFFGEQSYGTSNFDLLNYGNSSVALSISKETNAATFSSTISALNGNSTQWNTAYSYSQIGHLPLSGGTISAVIPTLSLLSTQAGGHKYTFYGAYNTTDDLVLRNDTTSQRIMRVAPNSEVYFDKQIYTLGNAVIHSGNIGSQSVNYANYSGYISQTSINEDTLIANQEARTWHNWAQYSTSMGNYNYGLHIGSPDPNYKFQLVGVAGNPNLYLRIKNITYSSWQKIWTDGNLTSTLSSGYLPYWNGSSLVNSVIIQSGSNIAIGRANADHKFDLQGSALFRNTLGNASFYFAQETDTSSTFYHYSNGTLKNVLSSNGYSYITGGLGIGYTDRTEKFAVAGSGYFNTTVQMAENINTNLRIPKVAPTNPTSGEYYFYIVE